MRSVLALFLASTLAAAACGGGSSSVTAPSPLGSGSPGASAGAIITGFVTAPSAPRSSVAMRPMATGLMVQVVGTSISVAVNADGSFTLTGVPGGDIQLRFTGPGVDATCTITAVQAQERIEIKVTINGPVAVVESQQRGNSDHASFPINGVVSDFAPPGAGSTRFTFNIGSQAVYGDAATEFYGDGDKPNTVADMKNGVRVEVKALRQADGSVYAVRIHINDDSDDEQEIEFTGKITNITPAGTGLTLTLGSVSPGGFTSVVVTTSTVVRRRGDVQSLSALQVGQTIEVEGTKDAAGTTFTVKKISIQDDEVDKPFEIEGTLGGLKGTCPALEFGVNGYSIYTTGATTFQGSSGCAALKNGDKVQVKGTKQADGRVLASEVKEK